jgi:hypothetical protein
LIDRKGAALRSGQSQCRINASTVISDYDNPQYV